MSDLHPELQPLAGFVGTWRGTGRGHYPTIDDFTYEEEVTFAGGPKPVLSYVQRTWGPDGSPLHSESGFLRAVGGRYEFVLSHAFGATEILEGSFEGEVLRLASTSVAISSSAKQIEATERILRVDGDTYSYDALMAAVGEPMTHHLAAELRRQG